MEWACAKVKGTLDMADEDLCELIHKQLRGYEIRYAHTALLMSSYCQIAWAAFEEHRVELACMLLQYEKDIQNRVPVLMAMNQEERAALEVADSHDPDLMQFVAVQIFNRYLFGGSFIIDLRVGLLAKGGSLTS